MSIGEIMTKKLEKINMSASAQEAGKGDDRRECELPCCNRHE